VLGVGLSVLHTAEICCRNVKKEKQALIKRESLVELYLSVESVSLIDSTFW
jgi:hypothetical protein